jgi:hypothetical protein
MVWAIVAFLSFSGLTAVQRDISEERVSFGFYRCDIRSALKEYFNASGGVSCSLQPGIRGKITFEKIDIGWEPGLQSMLLLEELTYRSEGSVFEIVKREGDPPSMALRAVEKSKFPVDPRIRVQDARVGKVGAVDGEMSNVTRLLFTLFRQVGVSFVIGPDVIGSVTVHFANLPLKAVLDRILVQVGAQLHFENGVYMVTAKGSYWPGKNGVASQLALVRITLSHHTDR